MGSLHARIIDLIREGRWGLTWHAQESIEERELETWQVVGLTPQGRLLRELPQAKPRPKVEIEILLPDGTMAKVVWVYDPHMAQALLVTAHFIGKESQ